MVSQKFRKRELEVIECLLEGKSNKQIAQKLGISVRTVEFHLSNIYARLDTHSRTEAVIKLTEMKLRQPASKNTSKVLRKSTVAKTTRSVDNGGNQNKRRFPMKNLLIGLTAGVILTILVAFAFSYMSTTRGVPGAIDPSGPTPTLIPFEGSDSMSISTETATPIPAILPTEVIESFPTALPAQTATKVP